MAILLRGPVHGIGETEAGVLVEDGQIVWVGTGDPPGPAEREIIAEPGETIAPGFIDLQVNGFNRRDAAEGAEAISAISRMLPASGVTGFLATIISSPLEEVQTFVRAARVADSPGARVLGAHVEGPFLNPEFLGAHDPANLMEPTPERIATVLAAAPRMMTLAPEQPGGLEAVARLHQAGVIVAAGHTGADFELGQRAIEAGVRFGTHLYNAMRAFHHRRPGVSAALLLDDRVTVGLIGDGEHLHAATVEEVVRLKRPTRVALTTDQVAAAGAPPGRYRLGGRDVVSDGSAVRLEDGTLAGSVATMDVLVRRMAELKQTSLEGAITAATESPATVLGEAHLGRLCPGAHADVIILDRELRVRLTMIAGRVVFER
jgi:N-acetylglucosamine-6-phosphate deacetylase